MNPLTNFWDTVTKIALVCVVALACWSIIGFLGAMLLTADPWYLWAAVLSACVALLALAALYLWESL